MTLRTISSTELRKILIEHQKWVQDNTRGEQADLSGVDLSNSGDLAFKSLPKIILNRANLSGADLTESNFRGAKFKKATLTGAFLHRSCLEGAKFQKAVLEDISLVCANLTKANFYQANLIGADFTMADLKNANLVCAVLRLANFHRADLTDANLTQADLRGAYLYRAKIERTSLAGARTDPSLWEGLNRARPLARTRTGS